MKSWKVWQLLALIFPSYLCGSTIGVEIKLCSPAIKNEPCNMTCHVQDFSQPIDINCNGTSRGSCSNIFCPLNMIKEGGNTIHLEIASLSYAMDNCNWTCSFGIVFSSAKRLEVKSGILEPINITSQNNANGGVKLTATADCLHPASPIVIVQYSEQHTGSYASLTQQVDLESSNNIGGCSDAVERRVTAMSDVSAEHEELAGKNVFFKMRFSQYPAGPFTYTNITGPFSFEGFTTPSSTLSSDMSTTTTVSEVPPPPVTTSSAGLSQEIVITIISSIIAAGVLIFLTVLVVNVCRQKNRQTPAKKSKENCFATKQGNFTKKDALKSSSTEPRIKLSGKRNTKQESISLDKFEHTQFNNSQAPKDRMYEHNPQTTDYMYLNNIQNQHVFNHSYAGRNLIRYGNQHDRYPKSHSRPNHTQLYQSHYPEHPGQNTGMFQYYRADDLYKRQQMYQRPYDVLYDSHIIDDKQDDKRSSKGRAYEKNWDLLY